MKKSIIILVILLSNLSCQNEKIQELEQKITELEKKNTELQYHLDNYEEISILHSQLVGIPESKDFKVNKKGIINFGFWKYGEIRKFKVYRKDKGKEKLELVYDNLTESQFKLEFTPKSLDDNELEIVAEFESSKEGSIIQVPTKMGLNIIK